tara:strand:- start:345 stop:725 length:381 start_codon:yes stop_codon:yes gene_type:complete
MKNNISSNRTFGILFFVVFSLIGLWPLINLGEPRIWSLIISVIFLILGLINSKLLSPLNKIWVMFGELIGKIIAPIVMGIVFFIIITPIGLFMRLIGKDLLQTKFSKKNSYWINRKQNVGPMNKQY